MRELLLASTSPWRRQMLDDVGIAVRGVSPGVDEDCALSDPVERATALALRKAHAVLSRHPNALVLGADQVVTDGREIWGKPRDQRDHVARLRGMRGGTHQLVTGFAVVREGMERVGHRITVMSVRADVTNDEIADYVASGEGSGCAGGYAAEARGAFLFDRVDGDWHNVIGLPIFDVIGVLRELGWRYGGGA